MLGNRAHEGLQPPSIPEERKRLKEAQSTTHVHSAAPPRPSKAPRISASLEGAEPTLEREVRLHLARGHPSTERTNDPSAHPPTVRRH